MPSVPWGSGGVSSMQPSGNSMPWVSTPGAWCKNASKIATSPPDTKLQSLSQAAV